MWKSENVNEINGIVDLENKKQQIEELANKVFKIIFFNDHIQDGMQSCLSLIGEFFNVSRMYVFENYRDDKYCCNTFEWCNKGIKPEIDNLQKQSYEDDLGTAYYAQIKAERLVHYPDVSKLNKRAREFLEKQNIKSMLHHAIYDGDKFMGFVGFDECKEKEYSWVKEHQEILIFFSKVISAFLIKKKKSDFLKEKLELIGSFMERRTNGVCIVNKKTYKVTYVNENLNKESFKDSLIKTALNIYLGKSYDKKCFVITKELVNKSLLSTFTFRIEAENRTFTVEVRNVMSYGNESRAFYFTEITKTVRLRSVLENTIEATKQSRQAKKDFIALLGNGLKEPINEMIASAQECSEKIDDERFVKEKILEIKSIVTHLSNMVNDVLDMKKIEKGAFILQHDKFDLKKEIEKVVAIVKNTAKRKQQLFVENIELEHSGFEGDLKKVKRVLYNILINAVTYTTKGGEIRLKISEIKQNDSEDAIIEIIVIDNGPGISEKKLKEIFDFERSKYVVKMGGLGLILTKSTLNAVGGTIDIISKLKKGTKVKIEYSLKLLTLPECLKENIPYKVKNEERFGALNINMGEARRLPEVAEMAKNSCLSNNEIIERIKGLNILIAEDNNINKVVLKRILTRIGIKVSVCERGDLVLKKFLKSIDGQYDLILMDIQMPVMDGYEATRKIRKSNHPQRKSIPILALSANIFLDDIEISKKVGMNAHLVKPIHAESLYKKIFEYTRLDNYNKSGCEL